MMRSKIHATLLSVFPLFKFRFDAPLIHNFIKSLAVASIPGFFICMWCAAKKHCLANNVLGISSRIQLLFPPAEAAFMLFIGDTVISGICVALALCIAVPRGSKSCFFNYTFLQYIVCLTVIIIIMNWFRSGQDVGQPALQYAASGVVGFVLVHCLWNGGVKQGDKNQPMSEVWDWNIYVTKLKKCHGWFLNTANEDGDGDEDNDGGEDDAIFASEDSDDEVGGEDDATFASEDSDDDEVGIVRAVQLLAIRANFRISAIVGYDWYQCRNIYTALEGEVQEEGTDLVLNGPYRMLEAYGDLCLKVFAADDEGSSTDEGSGTGPIYGGWDVTEPDEVEEFTKTIYGGLGRKVEVTYVVIPDAVETHVEVRLNLIDLGSRSRAVYGSVKASAFDYGSKSVHLFSRERGRSLSLPCGSTCILPLRPYMIALEEHFKLHIEVDLRVITSCDSQEEDKNFKFCLDCSRRIRSEERLEPAFRIRSQKREFNGDQVEANVMWRLGV